MGRQRMIRPELFVHEGIFAAEKATGLPLRLAYIGLWTQCDREGRFEWRPQRLKLAILPWDEIDFAAVLCAIADAGFITRYEVDGREFGCIPSWSRHQKPHHQEAKSVIPAQPEARSPSHSGVSGVRESLSQGSSCDGANGFGDSPSSTGESPNGVAASSDGACKCENPSVFEDFGESPSSFAPSPEAHRLISPETQDGDGTKDGVGTPRSGGGNPDDCSPEWMSREFILRYRGPIKLPEITNVSKFFAGLSDATDPNGVMDAIKDRSRDSTQTLLDFGNFVKAKLNPKGKTNGNLSSEAMGAAVLANIQGGRS